MIFQRNFRIVYLFYHNICTFTKLCCYKNDSKHTIAASTVHELSFVWQLSPNLDYCPCHSCCRWLISGHTVDMGRHCVVASKDGGDTLINSGDQHSCSSSCCCWCVCAGGVVVVMMAPVSKMVAVSGTDQKNWGRLSTNTRMSFSEARPNWDQALPVINGISIR